MRVPWKFLLILSQVGFPGVVSTPIPQPHPLALPSSSDFLLSSFRGSKSFRLLFADISAKIVSSIGALIQRVLLLISSFFPLYFSLSLQLLPFYLPATLDSTSEGRGSFRNSHNEYQINESISVNFNFRCLPAVSYILVTSCTYESLLTDMIVTHVCFA